MPDKIYVYIVFTTLNHWISRMICWFTRGKWSHVEIFLPDGRLLGAMPGKGVITRKFSSIAKSKYRVDRIRVKDENAAQTVYWAARQELGKPYDWAAIFGFVFRRNWQKPKKWFCSELVAWSFQRAGEQLLDTKASFISPRDIDISPKVESMDKDDWEAWKLTYNIDLE